MVIYDVTSSYYEGKTCPLAHFGLDRDGKTGYPIIVYVALTVANGRPIAVQVYPGYTGDPKTIPDQVKALTKRFGLSRVVLLGDRGMLTHTRIDVLTYHPGIVLDLGVSPRCDPAPVGRRSPDPGGPGGRTTGVDHLACILRRAAGGVLRPAADREGAEEAPGPARGHAGRTGGADRDRGAPCGSAEKAAAIGVKAGTIIYHYKLVKDFILSIRDGNLALARMAVAINNEELLDGIYVFLISEPAERLTAAVAVRSYEPMALVDLALRCPDTRTTRPLAVPTDIRRGDAVSEEIPSGLNDALLVRKYT